MFSFIKAQKKAYFVFVLLLLSTLSCREKSKLIEEIPEVALWEEQQEIELSVSTLRKILENRNIPLLMSLNKVHMAKDKVAASRAQLLPSLNVSLTTIEQGGLSFAVPGVSFLLNFLIPSNWFSLKQSKLQLKADEMAYEAAVLDQLASVLSLMKTVEHDEKVAELMRQSVNDLKTLEIYSMDLYRLGRLSELDLNLIKVERLSAELKFQNSLKLLREELAAIKSAFSIPMEKTIRLEDFDVIPPEDMLLRDDQDLLLTLQENSLELEQLKYLHESAKREKWKRGFSFISSASLSQQSLAQNGESTNVGLSFNEMKGGASINIGFDYFPNLRMSQKNIIELELRQMELRQEQSKMLFLLLRNLEESSLNLSKADEMLSRYREILKAQSERFQKGSLSLRELLEVHGRYSQILSQWNSSKLSQDLLVINFLRAFRMEYFEPLKTPE